jgi:hypothetical protein
MEVLLSAKLSLVGCDVTCNLLSSFLEGNFDTIRLFEASIGIQRCPASIPVKLGYILRLD